MGGKSSPPPAPDYSGAAVATAQGNKDAAIASQQGSMVNQNTPYGSLNYSQRGLTAQGNPTYQADYNLSPVGQKLLDYGNQSALDLGSLQNASAGRVANTFSQPQDTQSVNDIYNKSYALNTSRLDPQWDQNTKANDNKLANQGIMPGSEAYDNEMRTFNEGKNDAYNQAQQSAIATMPQTYQLSTAQRNQPLNELNALRTGSQVTNPQFSQQPGMANVGGPNYLGAAQSQYGGALNGYNAQVGQQNSFMNGLFGLGAAGIGAYPF